MILRQQNRIVLQILRNRRIRIRIQFQRIENPVRLAVDEVPQAFLLFLFIIQRQRNQKLIPALVRLLKKHLRIKTGIHARDIADHKTQSPAFPFLQRTRRCRRLVIHLADGFINSAFRLFRHPRRKRMMIQIHRNQSRRNPDPLRDIFNSCSHHLSAVYILLYRFNSINYSTFSRFCQPPVLKKN